MSKLAKTPFAERLSLLIDGLIERHIYSSRRQFALAAKLNEVSLSDNLKKGTEPRFSTLESILITNPTVSAEWLMRGEGGMFRSLAKMDAGGDNIIMVDRSHHTASNGSTIGDGNVTSSAKELLSQLQKENSCLAEQIKVKDEQLKVKDEQLKVKDEQIASLFAIIHKQ